MNVIEKSGVVTAFTRLNGSISDPQRLAALVGRCHSEELRADYDALIREGELYLNNPDTWFLSGVFKRLGDDLFGVPGIVVRFKRDAAGRGSGLTIGIRRAHIDFVRTAE